MRIKPNHTELEPLKSDFGVQIYSFFGKRTFQLLFAGSSLALLLTPSIASASFLSKITRVAEADILAATGTSVSTNSQKIEIAEPNIGPNSLDGTLTPIDDSITNAALVPKVGPVGSTVEVAEIPESGGQIIIYTVHAGDTIGSVAQMFGVTRQTVMSSNNLTAGEALKVGDILAIPPVSGKIHLVKKGDTLATLAKKYSVSALDIAVYNDLDADSTLTAGDTIIIPDITNDSSVDTTPSSDTPTTDNDTRTSTVPATKPTSPKTVPNPKKSIVVPTAEEKAEMEKSASEMDDGEGPLTAHPMRVDIKTDLGKALLRPVSITVSRRTQGAHDIFGSAVDLGAPIGTPIMAAADGIVVLARSAGYNGGYGEYVIIMSNINGNIVQTIYAHMSEVIATVGEQVKRGEVIGKVGQTGLATGPHVHFEVHGALNPLTIDPNYTGE